MPVIENKKNRIRELDFARGTAIVCMIIMHFYYCADCFGGWDIKWTPFMRFVNEHCGAFFFLLSGVTANFGSRHIKRGLTVLFCGFILTAASVWLYRSGREGQYALYQWGALHCIGLCMILYAFAEKLPCAAQIVLGAALIAVGYYFYFEVRTLNPWIFPIGLRTRLFDGWDYKPLLPFGGWFLLGSGLGKILYKNKKPIFPGFKCGILEWVGRNSLIIYMVHLPVYYILFKTVLAK